MEGASMSLRRIVIPFLVLTFLVSWTSWLTLAALVRSGVLDSSKALFWVFIVIGGISPGVVAFIIRKTRDDAEGFRRLVRQHFKFKVHPAWYVYLVLVPLVLTATPWLITFASGGEPGPLFREPLWRLLVLVPVMILGGGLEEPGWRGVLLPELLKRWSLLVATLVVGVIWYVWHLPLWLVEGTGQATLNVWAFLPTIITLSFLFTVLWWKTSSIGLCIVFHAFFNAYPAVVQNPPVDPTIDQAARLTFAILLFLVFWMAGRSRQM
jgi:membrane protease YdiL (CAAX protease family)